MQELIFRLNDRIQVKISDEDERDIIRKAAFWASLPSTCQLCGASVAIQYRHPAGFEYYGLECTGPVAHETNFGQRKDGTGLYYKGQWKERPSQYHEDEDDTATQPQPVPAQIPGAPVCRVCQLAIPRAVNEFSMRKFGIPLCQQHQANPYPLEVAR